MWRLDCSCWPGVPSKCVPHRRFLQCHPTYESSGRCRARCETQRQFLNNPPNYPSSTTSTKPQWAGGSAGERSVGGSTKRTHGSVGVPTRRVQGRRQHTEGRQWHRQMLFVEYVIKSGWLSVRMNIAIVVVPHRWATAARCSTTPLTAVSAGCANVCSLEGPPVTFRTRPAIPQV